ncbi:MAG: DUF2442 domain-containing protein [Deltaproteobacteria bacterium]|nr:MAG: DUF2442 domain-containing protein [Deltaproteobacteria bacterium]
MNKFHKVRNLKIEGSRLIMEIDGEMREYDLKDVSQTLSDASDTEKMIYEISPSGYGIYWPLIDEDISVDGLLGIVHQPECEEMMA